jgi:hypothetical protein
MQKKQTQLGLPEYANSVTRQRAEAMQKIREQDARRIKALRLPPNHAHFYVGGEKRIRSAA